MHDLTPLTALGTQTPAVETIRGVTLAEVPNLALASVAARVGYETACEKNLADLLNAPTPEPGQYRATEPETAFWIGAMQWMVMAPFDTHENIAAMIKSRLGDTASVTEQTDAWVCFDLSGQNIEAVMEISCNLNTRKMGTGDAHRTSIHHLGCFVLNFGPEKIRILGPRSSAGSLHHALKTAMISAL
ncbi:MAG: sarcosine oxidase subunit gamma [Paracoccaceae bacterium]